jgi:SNF2 family DNA or RNA helicase
MNELDGNEAINEQFVRRLFRPGRKGDFQHVKLIANETLDENVLGANLARAVRNRQTLRAAA